MVPALSSMVSAGWVIDDTGELSVCPNTMVNGAPSRSSSVRTSGAGTSDPPEQIASSCDRSVVSNDGCSISATSIVGTPSIDVPL